MQSINDIRTILRLSRSSTRPSAIVYGYAGDESHGCYWLCLDRGCPSDDPGTDAPAFGSALTLDRANQWADRHLASHEITDEYRDVYRLDITASAGRAIRHALGLGY